MKLIRIDTGRQEDVVIPNPIVITKADGGAVKKWQSSPDDPDYQEALESWAYRNGYEPPTDIAEGINTKLASFQARNKSNLRKQDALRRKIQRGINKTKAQLRLNMFAKKFANRRGKIHQMKRLLGQPVSQTAAGGKQPAIAAGKQLVHVSGYQRRNKKTGDLYDVRAYTQMRRKDIEQLLTDGDVNIVKRLGGGVEDTFIGQVTDQYGEKAPVVFKLLDPKIGAGYTNRAENEATAPIVAEVLNLESHSPVTIVREGIKANSQRAGNGKWRGSVMQFINHDVKASDDIFGYGKRFKYEDRSKFLDKIGDKVIGRLALYDYVIGNGDRHDGNWMTDGVSKIYLVDHERSFRQSDHLTRGVRSRFGVHMAGDVWNPGSGKKVKLSSVIGKDWDGLGDKLKEAMKRGGLTDTKITNVLDRYNDVISAKNDGKTFEELPMRFWV